jgi:hypothetical protein
VVKTGMDAEGPEDGRPTGEPMIRGAIVLNNLVGFEDVVGRDVVMRAIGSLPPELVEEARAIVPSAWVRAELVDAVFSAIAHEAGRTPEDLFPLAIERGVHRTLHTVWRALMHLSTDAAIMKRTPSLFARSYSRGRLTSNFTGSGTTDVELVDWPDVSRFRLIAIASGIRAVLRVAGRKDVEVTTERTLEGARFHARWRR